MYTVGQKVWADYGKYSRIEIYEGTVIAVSPTGVAKVDFGRRVDSFLSNSRMRGADKWHGVYLQTDMVALEKRRETSNANKRQDIAKDALGTLNAIGINASNKDRLLKALNDLTLAVNAL